MQVLGRIVNTALGESDRDYLSGSVPESFHSLGARKDPGLVVRSVGAL